MMTETFKWPAKHMRIETSKLFSEVITKVAAAKASPAVVSIISHDVPAEMAKQLRGYIEHVSPAKEYRFEASGMVIECQIVADATYLCTVLAPASLFQRPNQVSLDTIKIDVVGPTRLVYNGKLLACDFHYNLAAIIIQSPTPLQTVTFSPISDVLSINPTHLKTTSCLRPHYSHSLDDPDTKIFSIWRASTPPYPIYPVSCLFRSRCPKGFSCNELYELDIVSHPMVDGGPVLNSFGEVVGIYFNNSSFLPSNILSRWWNHYKSFGEFRRPFLGMEVANLHAADLDFLREFTTRFPNIYTAVFVTKVEEDSPAARCGIRAKDVIVKLDGKQVKSKMQFFATIWENAENAGRSVEFNVCRVTDGKELNLSLVIEEASPVKFHQWPHPHWTRVHDYGKLFCIKKASDERY